MYVATHGLGMDGINNFQLNDELVEQTDTDIIKDEMGKIIQDIERKKLRLLAHAFVDGYDGIDIKMEPNTDWKDSFSQFKYSFEYEGWKDEPPELERYASGVHRYDFRQLDNIQKRELVAHIGLTEVPEDRR
jgi:hypothetical protein